MKKQIEMPSGHMYRLGCFVTDSATGLKGMLTHMQIEMNQIRYYRFQPPGLNPEDGSPVNGIWLVAERILGGDTEPEPMLPLEVLGTYAEDEATGFAGTATALTLHLNHCIHVCVTPKGTLAKTGAPIQSQDFDIRRLKGPAIKKLTREEVKKSLGTNPGPMAVTRHELRKPSC